MTNLSFFRRMSLHTIRKPVAKGATEAEPLSIEQQTQQPGQPDHAIPETQTVLLLHAPQQPYQLNDSYPVPRVEGDSELLVRSRAIGLNPIDWKSPDFGFAIPELPYISGRELAGDIVHRPRRSSRLKAGDRVLVISTDYRDLRKAAYQEYAVAFDYNTVRLPRRLSYEEGSTLGVAFVAAAMALGVCMGVDFSNVADGPDLFSLVRRVVPSALADDIRGECLDGIQNHDRALAGDWLTVWGGSSTSANLTIQLARLAGLRTVAVVDKAKHGVRLSNHSYIRTDLLVDSYDPARAVDIIRTNLQGKLRFGIDTRGRESAAYLLRALGDDDFLVNVPPSPPATPYDSARLTPSSHLIGLTGLPKGSAPEGVLFHTVPIKLFHEVPEIGEALSAWLERLLESKLLSPPDIIDVEQGLKSVNKGLDRMRRGEISGGKLVVRV